MNIVAGDGKKSEFSGSRAEGCGRGRSWRAGPGEVWEKVHLDHRSCRLMAALCRDHLPGLQKRAPGQATFVIVARPGIEDGQLSWDAAHASV